MSRVDDMPAFLGALIAAAVLFALTYFLYSPPAIAEGGLTADCSQINLPRPIAVGIQFLLLWMIASMVSALNRRFNIEEGTSALPATFFVIGSASLPAVDASLSAAMLLPLGCILTLRLLFISFEREQTAANIFLIASTLSFGSLVSVAFIPLAIGAAIAAAMLRELNLQAIAAFIFGLGAPYAIVIGFGIVDPDAIALPALLSFTFPLGWTYLAVAAVTALTAIFILLRQAVGAITRTSRALAFNKAINVILLIMLAAAALDLSRLVTYLPAIMLLTGFPIASLASERGGSPGALVAILSIFFVTIYFFAI